MKVMNFFTMLMLIKEWEKHNKQFGIKMNIFEIFYCVFILMFIVYLINKLLGVI